MKSLCYIVGAGEYSGYSVDLSDAYIIAADAGLNTLIELCKTPDIVIGDYDSLGKTPEDYNFITVPVEKNDTDMGLAISEGFRQGAELFIIDGGLGGRLDHTLANIQLLKDISLKTALGILLGRDICITVLTNSTLRFSLDASGVISVFAFGGLTEGVSLKGLKYPLDNVVLTDIYPVGTSNEFTNENAEISVQEGSLIITWESQPVTLMFKNGRELSISKM